MFNFRHVTGKLANMRKPQEFTICPVSSDSPHIVTIQSDKRIARFDRETGKVMVSDGKGGHQGFHKLNAFCGAKEYDAPQWLIDQIQEQLGDVKSEASKELTGPVVICG